MTENDIRNAVIADNEVTFSHNGRNYLLYGWDQCDGYFLSLECDGSLVWQSAPMSKAECIADFFRYCSEL
ncbi:hypothetical protein [Ruminococcus sp.]|uniref:hypothetical protein n=1 Tax=Ruminococcus sp. TaxID=41978 RepID=UPI0025F790DA|nr:hypothetical protein [Ruminococcus sp.]MBQ6252941.1 hypothetical protein [Ruminococcus sp.]